MYTFITCIVIGVILCVVEVFFKGPAIVPNLFERAERLRYRGYFALLGWAPLSIVAAFYGLATIAGLYFGFVEAWYDVGTMFCLIFLMGIVGSFFSFLGDVGSLAKSTITGKERGATPGVRTLSSIVFIAGMYGSLVLVVLKTNGIVLPS